MRVDEVYLSRQLQNPVLGIRDMQLKTRILRMSMLERRLPSHMAQIILEDAVEAKEQELGLPPIEDDKEFQKVVGQ